MENSQSVLTYSQVRAYYDKFGRKQDLQGFYEDPALDDLVAHAAFQNARKIFEFGCGTGKLAERLLAEYMASSASYFGCDVSATMVGLATHRLLDYGKRAKVVWSNGIVYFPLPDQSVDRVVSTYVLDLLSMEDVGLVFTEAHRVLTPEGKLCFVSLTKGVTFLSRMVSSIWMTVFRLRASLVGGCRPIQLERYVDPKRWYLEYRNVMISFGLPSEILVLARR